MGQHCPSASSCNNHGAVIHQGSTLLAQVFLDPDPVETRNLQLFWQAVRRIHSIGSELLRFLWDKLRWQFLVFVLCFWFCSCVGGCKSCNKKIQCSASPYRWGWRVSDKPTICSAHPNPSGAALLPAPAHTRPPVSRAAGSRRRRRTKRQSCGGAAEFSQPGEIRV